MVGPAVDAISAAVATVNAEKRSSATSRVPGRNVGSIVRAERFAVAGEPVLAFAGCEASFGLGFLMGLGVVTTIPGKVV
jgi:hypothetical protein